MIPEREVVQYDRKSPLIFQSLYLAAVLTMKRSHNFEPAALLAAPLPRTFLLFSALLATLSAPVSAGEPQRQSADLPSAAGHESPGLSVVRNWAARCSTTRLYLAPDNCLARRATPRERLRASE
jgi:hypothetical protein